MPDITLEQIDRTKKSCFARETFISKAIKAGYSDSTVYRPRLKPYIIRKLHADRYQEKHVDTSVVALLIRAAITRPRDYHVVITGDSDILPAIRVAYPEYTKNVFLATSHPDELNADHRQTSFSLSAFHFDIHPIYFQDHIPEIIHGEHVYNCSNCNKVLVRPRPIPRTNRPYCKNCRP